MKPRPWMAVAALMVAVVLLRIFPGWSFVVRPDREPRLPDPDAYYHFRQAAYTAEHFPHLMRWEDFSLYPEVMRNDAAGLYDLALAAGGKLVALGGLPLPRALWWFCLWFPPLCVAAILPFVYLLVRRQAAVAAGLGMALWYVLIPGGTLTHMTIGICDHHVVEMLLSVLCIFLLQRLVVRERERPAAWWKPAWGSVLPLVIIQFTWTGGPLYLPILGLAGAGQLVADVWSGVGARPMVRAGARYWLAFLALTGGAGLLCPTLILLPELWRASVAGAGGVLLALPLAAWWFETPRLRWAAGTRLAIGAAATVALSALGLLLFPHVRELLGEGLAQKSTLVAENHEVSLRYYFIITSLPGLLGWLAPVVGIAFGAWRRPAWWISVLPSMFFVGLWVHTYDYVYQGALHSILLTGYALGAMKWSLTRAAPLAVQPDRPLGIAERSRRFAARPRTGPKALKASAGRPVDPLGGLPASGQICLAALTAVALFLVWPMEQTVPLWLPASWYRNGSEIPSDGWIEAMHWMRESTPAPPPVDFSAPGAPRDGVSPRGRVGVMTDWSAGQYVNTLAARPSTASRYPEPEGIAPFFMRTEEEVRAAPMRGSTVAEAVRYVALDPKTIGEFFGAHIATIGLTPVSFAARDRLVDGRGHTLEVPSLGPLYERAFAHRLVVDDGNGLSHFRLVFESRQQCFLRLTYEPAGKQMLPLATVVLNESAHQEALADLAAARWQEGGREAYFGHLVSDVKIFEQVPGARLEGRAEPGVSVNLMLALWDRSTGRAWLYRQTAAADPRGDFRLTVPYATGPAVEGVQVEARGPARLGWGSGSAQRQRNVMISPAAVEHGEVIRVD